MKEFEVLGKGDSLLVRATTRAGLITAAVQGLMAAAGPRTSEMDEKTERSFSVSADDFGQLLAGLLTSATEASAKNKEAYEDIHFTLITDKKAEGTFVGRPAKSFHDPLRSPKGKIEVAKNEGGEWETVIALQ